MIRKIIHIDSDKCSGCGICVSACHEGAIGLSDGKAVLLREDYCDGLGDCLPACPTGAITFEMREAAAYDRAAVEKHMRASSPMPSNWPVQIKLAPVSAEYFSGARLLIAADCTAFAYADAHKDFISGRVVIIGCPKLDGVDYSEKLSHIFALNDIRDITLLRMEVPCCGGLEMAVRRAIEKCGKNIPLSTAVISTDGRRIK